MEARRDAGVSRRGWAVSTLVDTEPVGVSGIQAALPERRRRPRDPTLGGARPPGCSPRDRGPVRARPGPPSPAQGPPDARSRPCCCTETPRIDEEGPPDPAPPASTSGPSSLGPLQEGRAPAWRCPEWALWRPSSPGYTDSCGATSMTWTSTRQRLELVLKKRKYQAVFGLFRYCVLTPRSATYLCNKASSARSTPQARRTRSSNLRLEDVLGVGQEPPRPG